MKQPEQEKLKLLGPGDGDTRVCQFHEGKEVLKKSYFSSETIGASHKWFSNHICDRWWQGCFPFLNLLCPKLDPLDSLPFLTQLIQG